MISNVGYSIISILNRTNSTLHVYLYTPELFDKANTIFDKLEIEHEGRIKFMNFKINFRNQWNFWNPYTFARIYAVDKIPVSKCIYLDSDVYGCGDINSLWKVKLGNNLVAAALDKVPFRNGVGQEHMNLLNSLMDKKEIQLMNNTGLTEDLYFNNGVLYLIIFN